MGRAVGTPLSLAVFYFNRKEKLVTLILEAKRQDCCGNHSNEPETKCLGPCHSAAPSNSPFDKNTRETQTAFLTWPISIASSGHTEVGRRFMGVRDTPLYCYMTEI